MYNGLKYALIFSVGAVVGGLATWKIAKAKYEQIAQEEIESVKKVYSAPRITVEEVAHEEPDDSIKEFMDTMNRKPDLASYVEKVREEGYVKYNDVSHVDSIHVTNKEVTDVRKPYVIPPEEFGEEDGYGKLSFTYYADEVLTNEANEIVDDVDDIVGSDSLTHFGEYEEDSVFVRNDALKVDIEILLDERNYTDILDG